MTERVEQEYERRMRLEREWLAALKIGDEVLLDAGRARIAKIERATPTQWIVGVYRFNKKTGYVIGHGRSYLKEPTQGARDAIETRDLAEWVESLVRHGRTAVSLAKLRAMKAAHDNNP